MADETVEGPLPSYVLRSDQELNVDLDALEDKVSAQQFKIMFSLGLGATGLGLALVANMALKKLLTNIVGMNNLLTEHHQVLTGQRMDGRPADPKERVREAAVIKVREPEASTIAHGRGIDETRTAPGNTEIAPAAEGPTSQVSDADRMALEAEGELGRLLKGGGITEELDESVINTDGKLE